MTTFLPLSPISQALPRPRRPLLSLIESFGFDHLIYGSDWPVSETHRYPTWVTILDDLTAGCSEEERRQLFRDNALAFYRQDR